MNDHQKNAQYSGVRDGDAPLDRNVQPILWCGSMLSCEKLRRRASGRRICNEDYIERSHQ
jgi:hypothetical protein